MTFTATYRDKTGAMREKRVEAVGRSEAMAALKAQGIVPIRVEAISGASAQRHRVRNGEGTASRRSAAYVITVASVLLTVSGLWWWLARPTGTVTPSREKPKTTVMPKEVGGATNVSAKSTSGVPGILPQTMDNNSLPKQAAVPAHDDTSSSTTNVAGKTAKPKSPYRNGVEQVLGWIFNCEMGKPPPPLPDFSPADSEKLVSILLSKNPVEEGDSARVADAKEMVELAKKELLDFMKDGGKAGDFLTYYRGELTKAYHERTDAQKLVLATLREDAETGMALAEEINKKLSERGIKPVFIPPKYRKLQ